MRRILLGLGLTAALAAVASATAAPSAAPSDTSLPTISGSARDGSILTATDGRWTGSPRSFAYQWERCDGQGGACGRIGGADAFRYTIVSADVGHRLRVVVSATNADGTGQATSGATGAVAATGHAPLATRLPVISGGVRQGATLTVDHGSWKGTRPISFDYSWQRCDGTGNGCSTFIVHSKASTYTLGSGDVGHRMRVEVTATNARGSTSVFSDTTGVVAAPAPPATTIAIQNVALPDRLVINAVSFSPNPVVSRNAPITARFHVADTKGLSVQGALVYALGLPYGWTYNAPEQPTDTSGWATITIQPTRAMPLRRGGDLVLFVRARKPGDNLLAGVSTRRLVQVGIG
jgi:hypothetical protein